MFAQIGKRANWPDSFGPFDRREKVTSPKNQGNKNASATKTDSLIHWMLLWLHGLLSELDSIPADSCVTMSERGCSLTKSFLRHTSLKSLLMSDPCKEAFLETIELFIKGWQSKRRRVDVLRIQ
jgi:hypothetical protein